MTKRYLVVGNGILGAATAARLASRGQQVTLLDGGSAEETASARSLGWINDAAATSPAYHTLRTLGRLRLAHEQLRSSASWYHPSGRLDWGSSSDRQLLPTTTVSVSRESIDDEIARLASQGQDIYPISAQEAQSVEPTVDWSRVRGTVLYEPEDAWVDLPLLIHELNGVVKQHGGRIVSGLVNRLLTDDNHAVSGVQTVDGQTIDADNIIVAAGSATTKLLAPIADIPESSNIGVTITTEPVDNPPRTLLRMPFAGVRPDASGRLVIVASRLEELVDAPGQNVPDEAVRALLDAVGNALEGKPVLHAESVKVGIRPIPADGYPVVGTIAGTNVSVVFTHSGATVGLLLGQLLGDELVDGNEFHVLDDFRPQRFASI
ncbi:NAD(P)/FAD-dependent oxidoreductase [Bifidobacterium scaligerum]|uniref:FAD dependent oxidoreductase domain-containing protein n=1 Tax=Bifidobacterium scaligerum TaxID=2052656 RepID=A0A2M9HP61_9BIFI|nr:FAD-dependent oxidoreductase [Bifidobacterium scaligerum]PJM78612.1 hypothetical protein CUU80_08430 [Bifidobacterium scaligerum]